MKTDMEGYWKPYERFECNDSMGNHKKREQRKVLTGTITGSMLVR
jgi:hypothetical protein